MNEWPEPLNRYLRALFVRARPSTLVEVRWRVPTGMSRCFARVENIDRFAEHIAARATSTDVYVGVLPRWRSRGGRGAVVGDARTVWVDLDTVDGRARLADFRPAPHIVVRSGGPGHLHAYWMLGRALTPAQVERVNRRLAWALGGDLNSTDAARILRPPQTFNHARGCAPVELVTAAEQLSVGVRELVGGLPDPPPEFVPGRGSARRPSRRDELLRIAPERYVSVLTGQRVGHSRKVRCPLHDDTNASFHVYHEPGRGWYCFGCQRGGSIYDLAAALWGIEPRGSAFLALRDELRVTLGHGRPKR